MCTNYRFRPCLNNSRALRSIERKSPHFAPQLDPEPVPSICLLSSQHMLLWLSIMPISFLFFKMSLSKRYEGTRSKIFHMRNYAPRRGNVRISGSTAPRIRKCGIRWRCIASFTLRPCRVSSGDQITKRKITWYALLNGWKLILIPQLVRLALP
jgi:hypothetical protein